MCYCKLMILLKDKYFYGKYLSKEDEDLLEFYKNGGETECPILDCVKDKLKNPNLLINKNNSEYLIYHDNRKFKDIDSCVDLLNKNRDCCSKYIFDRMDLSYNKCIDPSIKSNLNCAKELIDKLELNNKFYNYAIFNIEPREEDYVITKQDFDKFKEYLDNSQENLSLVGDKIYDESDIIIDPYDSIYSYPSEYLKHLCIISSLSSSACKSIIFTKISLIILLVTVIWRCLL